MTVRLVWLCLLVASSCGMNWVYGAGVISFGACSAGPLRFNPSATEPPTNGWSTLAVGSSAGTITNASQLETAVQSLDATNIQDLLPQTGTLPPSTSFLARYNTNGLFLQTRPAGNDFTVLMATFRNDSFHQVAAEIAYDLQIFDSINESPGLLGHRVYYSLTGRPSSWVLIPEVSSTTNARLGGRLEFVSSGSRWISGEILYIIWVDDNGPGTDGALTIDNLYLVCSECWPPWIRTQPKPVIVENCSSTNLTVDVFGDSLKFQWFKDDSAIAEATTNSYSILSPSQTDNGTYFVRIGGCGGVTVESERVTVTVKPRIVVNFDGSDIHMSWCSGTTNLFEAHAPNAPPGDWTLVPNQSAGSVTITNASSQPGGMVRFYSLRE